MDKSFRLSKPVVRPKVSRGRRFPQSSTCKHFSPEYCLKHRHCEIVKDFCGETGVSEQFIRQSK